MGDVSNYYRDAQLNAIRTGTPFVGIFTTMPDATGAGGVEPVGGSYARKAITFSVPEDATPTGRKIVQAATVDFDQATGDWGEALGLGIWDALAGNLVAFKIFDAAETFDIVTGQQFRLLAAAASITVP